MKKPIYLDYAATTPVDSRVLDKMCGYLTHSSHFGNPGSRHSFGRAAKFAVDDARRQIADLINATPAEIIWTSGTTEANNLALKGIAELYYRYGKHIVTTKAEHPSILMTCQQLEKQGFSVTYLTPNINGVLPLDRLENALQKDTILVSISHVNNEMGAIQPIKAFAELTRSRNVLLHVDAAQSNGKLPINVEEIPLDLLSLCSHKIYGPKGIGALYIRHKPRIRVAAQIHGGGQERGLRSGTLPVHQIVGMGYAFKLAKETMDEAYNTLNILRNYFLELIKKIPSITVNGDLPSTYPGILNCCFSNYLAEDLMEKLPHIAFSRGSACHSNNGGGSYVLRALGYNESHARRSVRFSFGRFTTKDQLEDVVSEINQLIN